ncbi:MAG: hypothetical protein GC129_03665 [Proteobacteria bacterium]|nr:hypothetical protein [Pseudomonadota bacterium]
MIAGIAAVALIFVAADNAKLTRQTEPVRLAMAAALFSAAGQKRYEPPELVEKPAPPNLSPPKREAAPAKIRAPLHPGQPERDAPPILAERPKTEKLPAPIRMDRFAQATTNDDILRRIERLEQENRRLREQLKENPPSAQSPGSPSPQKHSTPAQMIPGWRVSLYPWNAEGFITGDPLKVFNVRNQRFSAVLGQHTPERSATSVMWRHFTSEMFVYKFEGWLHITREGTYQLGLEVNCPRGHPCNVLARLGDQQIFNEQHRNFENKILFQGRELPVGDYWIEVTFNLATSKFLKFDPQRVSIYPQIRGPGEYNFRDFGPQELLTEANASIPSGPPR